MLIGLEPCACVDQTVTQPLLNSGSIQKESSIQISKQQGDASERHGAGCEVAWRRKRCRFHVTGNVALYFYCSPFALKETNTCVLFFLSSLSAILPNTLTICALKLASRLRPYRGRQIYSKKNEKAAALQERKEKKKAFTASTLESITKEVLWIVINHKSAC